ncbi:MAG TPA: class I SAM-dependent methyltransferase [Syntrophorhabdaceae bacterium]|nr:class I SAM-dependent methyltransferase [Syntrophorhabdaceae bacterium]
MIPFNHLGPVFKMFASLIYPGEFRKVLESTVQRVRNKGTVLDVGSGTGILSQFAQAVRGDLRFMMVDPAPGMLRFAPGFAEKVIGRAESLPFPPGLFDAVFTGDVVHHFSDPAAALGEIQRVMRSGGVLVVFDIDPGSPLGALITRGEKIFREPAHFYRPERLAGLLAPRGFNCKIYRYGWRYSIIANTGDRQ